MPTKLRYLVAGTGRSGTVYLAKLLTSVQIPCGHEHFFQGEDLNAALARLAEGGANSACSQICGLESGTVPIAESSYLAVPFLDHDCLRGCTIIHGVRDPVKVIRSFLNDIQFFRADKPEDCHHHEQFIRKHLPLLNYISDPVCRACYYYIRWNQKVEESAGGHRYLLHRIEGDPAILLRELGLSFQQSDYQETNCNSFANWPSELKRQPPELVFSEDEIQGCAIWPEVALLAKKYGYDCKVGRPAAGRETAAAGGNGSAKASSSRPSYAPAAPLLIEEGRSGYNVILYGDAWYALAPEEGVFDPKKAANGGYTRCLSARSKEALLEALSQAPPADPRPLLVEEGYHGFNIVSCGADYYAIRAGTGAFRLEAVRAGKYKELFHSPSLETIKAEIERTAPDAPPQLMEEGFHGYNLICHRQTWYGLPQREGVFDPAKAANQEYRHCLCATSEEALKETIRKQASLEVEADRARLTFRPQLIEEGYHGFNILTYHAAWYGLAQTEGTFDPAKLEQRQYARCFRSTSLEELRAVLRKEAAQAGG
jgi:hypothetical protein